MLIVVGTPIGNLKDFSYRAVETLKECDLVLCEDTRRSRTLFNAYAIKIDAISFHRFNEKKREEQVIGELKKGKKIALVSDGGMPGICDPGTRIVARCVEMEIPIRVVPGPSPLISALSISGIDRGRFQFLGYCQKNREALKRQYAEIALYEGASILYEAPHRMKKTLALLQEIAPDAKIFLARELTKIHEECLRGTPETLLNHFGDGEVKGECILIFTGKSGKKSGTPREWVEMLERTFQLSRKEALAIAAKELQLPKNRLYKEVHAKDEE